MLFEQIAANKRKTALYIVCFVLFVLLIGMSVTYLTVGDWLTGVIITSILLLVYVPITIFSSTSIVMSLNHAKKIESKEQFPQLWYAVENLAMVARIPTPKIYVVNDPSPNAFASGSKPENAAVAVTTGLVEKLNREELEAVIAHEIGHIKNYDILLATVSLALVSFVAYLSDFGTRLLFSKSSSNNNKNGVVLLIGLVLVILAPIIAVVIQMGLSRNREYLADATGAELCRNPEALASALQKITEDKDAIKEISKASAAMYFADPFKKKAVGMFATHPPAQERIKRLLKM